MIYSADGDVSDKYAIPLPSYYLSTAFPYCTSEIVSGITGSLTLESSQDPYTTAPLAVELINLDESASS